MPDVRTVDRLMARGVWVDYDPNHGWCLEWRGAKHPKGYGKVWHEGKLHRVHRLIAAACHVPGDGPWALHRCNNPPCFNPAHLYWGTPKRNTEQAVEEGRWTQVAASGAATAVVQRAKSHCPAGHPYSGENLYVYVGSRGRPGRYCKTCRRESKARRRASHKKV